MSSASQWTFGPFRLDPPNACLWRGAERVPLPPTAFALLHYLVTHAGQLVTKDELFEALWPETVVGEAVLKVRMGEVRKALGETAREPRCIATVHRRGYRFIADVTEANPAPVSREVRVGWPVTTDSGARHPQRSSLVPHAFVGREAALGQLQG